MNYLRGALFNLLYTASFIVIGLPMLVIAPLLPYKPRLQLLTFLPRVIQGLLALTCGITYRVEGTENIPKGPFVLVSNHQSTWETFILSYLFLPLSTVLKKELTYIPVFGWLLRMGRPIVIDRKRKQNALKEILRQGQTLLDEGISVAIFPEGTRVPVGQEKAHFPGGAMLACKAGVPVLPVVHNAGAHWPAHRLDKIPGRITVRIGQPIATEGRSAKELSHELEQWINQEKQRLVDA